MKFAFLTDDKSRAFCKRIVKGIELLYDIDPVNGCNLLNKKWRGYDWRAKSSGGTSELPELIYHETAREWAERLGNPCPYEEGPEFDQWKVREVEAKRRIEEYRRLGQHDWLYD